MMAQISLVSLLVKVETSLLVGVDGVGVSSMAMAMAMAMLG